MPKSPFILLVNPWITDFAAFDLWAKPLGLLQLGSLLREGGCGVHLIDCLDRHDPLSAEHPELRRGKEGGFGTGRYPKMKLVKPQVYREIPRYYYRYGIHPESLRAQLCAVPQPDLIWVTSMMTYWYPGVRQTIEAVREVFPEVPVWLGGVYARLCSDHARLTSGADEVITLSQGELPSKIEAATGYSLKNKGFWDRFDGAPPPALDLLPHPTYAPVMASRGCPFRCPYCASGILQPVWERRGADFLYEEILKAHETFGLVDFAFYDDALLLHAENDLRPALERICREGPRVRFHTPNALHIRALTPDWCRLLYESGFTTLRLGLETTRADRQRAWGGKVELEMFFRAVEGLLEAGFSGERIGAYLLCGLPGQLPEEVAEAVSTVREAGAQPYLAEFSPVPGTVLWRESCAACAYDLEREPLYQNNTFFACRRPDFTLQDLQKLKALALEARHSHAAADPVRETV